MKESTENQASEDRGFTPLPWPICLIVREDQRPMAMGWANDLMPFFLKLMEWSFFFFLAYFGFGYSWVILLATLHFLKGEVSLKSSMKTSVMKGISESPHDLNQYPSWVKFPDFDKVDWINDIISQVWPKLNPFINNFVSIFIEPEIRRILDFMGLETVSGFKLKKIDLGNVPLSLGGIKVYNPEKVKSRDEVVLDAELIFQGNATVKFSLQGVQAKLHDIKFRGMARITLKPVLEDFPFFGGFEIYFLTTPNLDYSLGGIGTVAEMPGINSIVKTIINDQIRSRFVWPNRLSLYFPLEDVQKIPNKSYCLPEPMGLLTVDVLEGKNLMKKDNNLMGKGTSDPYVNISIGENKISFRDSYISKTVNPVWKYSSRFILEDDFRQNISLEIFDYDSSSKDDFLGSLKVDLTPTMTQGTTESWYELANVPHGELKLSLNWKPVTRHEGDKDSTVFVVSFFLSGCENLGDSKMSVVNPKGQVKFGKEDILTTRPQSKTRNPQFDEGCLFTANFLSDHIHIKILDSKNNSNLGWTKLELSLLENSPGRQFFDRKFPLEDSKEGKVVLSAKLYSISK